MESPSTIRMGSEFRVWCRGMRTNGLSDKGNHILPGLERSRFDTLICNNYDGISVRYVLQQSTVSSFVKNYPSSINVFSLSGTNDRHHSHKGFPSTTLPLWAELMIVPSRSKAATLQDAVGCRFIPWRQERFGPRGESHWNVPCWAGALSWPLVKKGWTECLTQFWLGGIEVARNTYSSGFSVNFLLSLMHAFEKNLNNITEIAATWSAQERQTWHRKSTSNSCDVTVNSNKYIDRLEISYTEE